MGRQEPHGLTNLMTDDRVVRFDPRREQWTVYQLPSIGCEPRNIAVDDVRGDVWVPCGCALEGW
ncbi:MAG: hypothetical protein DMF89_13875 [Acidobacteria bacterium]|nr:MAG: hypothetical protein DMF89_13875 [Acidobacteriota bacterium]